MKTLVVLAHPEPRSFNSYLASTAKTALQQLGGEVIISDLYAEGFDPRESPEFFSNRVDTSHFDVQAEQKFSFETNTLPTEVLREMDRLLWADNVIFQFPLWWFGPPAILKGWLDRVFVFGGMYASQMQHDSGRCAGKRALLSVTPGAPAEACSFNGIEGDTQLVLWPLLYSLRYVGFTVLQPYILNGISRTTSNGRVAEREGYRQIATEFAAFLKVLEDAPAMPFNAADHWNSSRQLNPDAPAYSPFIRQKRVLKLS